MKKNYFLAAIFSFAMISMNAQFTDDMEAYADGSPLSGQASHWTDWGCGGGVGCSIVSTTAFAHSGGKSGIIPGDGTTDAVLDLGNKIFGQWGLEFWMYVPAGKEAYFNFQGTVPVSAGTFPVGNIYFNKDSADAGNGFIDYGNTDETTWSSFSYPEDQWFKIIVDVDISTGISNSTFAMSVDGDLIVSPGHPFASWDPNAEAWDYTDTLSLGGMDLFSITTSNEYYLDDIVFQDSFILGTQNIEAKGFDAFKDRNNILNLKANETINNVAIYNMLGQVVYNSNINATSSTIDMSSFSNGTYIVKVNVNGTEGSIKVIR